MSWDCDLQLGKLTYRRRIWVWCQCPNSRLWRGRGRTPSSRRSHLRWDRERRRSARQWYRGGKCTVEEERHHHFKLRIPSLETYVEDGDFVDALFLVVRLSCQILVDVLEVGDRDVLLKLLIEDDIIIDELDLSCEIIEGAGTLASGSVCLFNHGQVWNVCFFFSIIREIFEDS